MKTTERLLLAAKDIWAAYSEHPFVLGLQDGTLDREKFSIQDYLYLTAPTPGGDIHCLLPPRTGVLGAWLEYEQMI